MKRKRFNKNFNCLNNFMTVGLLTSRRTKNKLHAKAVSEPTFININRYKVYKTVYSRTIRAAKKLYIANKITEKANNPKKTWQTLNELLGKKNWLRHGFSIKFQWYLCREGFLLLPFNN
jgi:hypothetical protein